MRALFVIPLPLAVLRDSQIALQRGTSHIDFKTATTGVAAKAMRNEISHLVATVDDPGAKRVSLNSHHPSQIAHVSGSQAFDTEMQSFFYLFTRYLSERAKAQDLSVPIFLVVLLSFSHCNSDWDRIKSPSEDQIVPYAKLPTSAQHSNLSKLAVLKVNGGLGTSMGQYDQANRAPPSDPISQE